MKYTLSKKEENLNTVKVTIVADSNDADYITEITTYSKEEFDEWVIDELIELKNYSGSYELPGFPGDLDIPYNGFDGRCHSLEYVEVEYTDKNGQVWDVNY